MEFVWSARNIEHIARHGISPDQAEYVVERARVPYPQMVGDGRRLVVGRLGDGQYVQVRLCPLPIGSWGRVCHARPTSNGKRKAEVPQENTMKKAKKHPEEMNGAELVEATAAFDQPFAFEKARPMTPAERTEERVLRRGRPRIGEGSRKISVSLERGMLRDADALARKRGMKRSELIASFVVAGLKRAG